MGICELYVVPQDGSNKPLLLRLLGHLSTKKRKLWLLPSKGGIENYSWTAKTCPALCLPSLMFISSCWGDLVKESEHLSTKILQIMTFAKNNGGIGNYSVKTCCALFCLISPMLKSICWGDFKTLIVRKGKSAIEKEMSLPYKVYSSLTFFLTIHHHILSLCTMWMWRHDQIIYLGLYLVCMSVSIFNISRVSFKVFRSNKFVVPFTEYLKKCHSFRKLWYRLREKNSREANLVV